jgi:ketosteroid isomerase-like protein
MAHVTPDLVAKAYGALATGNESEIAKYWADDMVWLVPGHNPLSGWYHGRQAFINFMKRVGELSGGSFNMETVSIMVNDDYSCDVTRNRGTRAGMPDVSMDIDVAHVLRWRNGKVIAGKGGIFGDGTDQYDHFWSARS